MMEDVLNWLLSAIIVIGIFVMFYMAYRQQGILDTVKEIKEIFHDKTEDIKDNLIYR